MSIRPSRHVGRQQPGIEPADEVTLAHVAEEEGETVGGLVQAAIAQVVLRDRAAIKVLGGAAGIGALSEAALGITREQAGTSASAAVTSAWVTVP